MHVLMPLFMLFVWLVCVPLTLKISLRKGDLPVGVALPRLWLGNPLRAVRNVYNIYAITAAVSARDRAVAVRGLGESRAALAVSDLIANLDDPDYEVREEAAAALGNGPHPQAIEALLARLGVADTDLGPQIARALRHADHPRAVEVLIRKLGDDDRELRCELARALGTIRDPRATKPLLDLLNHTTTPNYWSLAPRPSAGLGERAVIPRLLNELRASHSGTVKRSLELILADLLGRRGEFYKLLTREENARGGEVERLLTGLADATPDRHTRLTLCRARWKRPMKTPNPRVRDGPPPTGRCVGGQQLRPGLAQRDRLSRSVPPALGHAGRGSAPDR